MWDPVYRGGLHAFDRDQAVLQFIPAGKRWYCAPWYPPQEVNFDLYVDITTPPRWRGRSVRCVDLDLDVETQRDGQIDLLDQDEFEEHRKTLAYPPALIRSAVRSAAWVQEAVRSGVEPFGDAWKPWYKAAFGRLPGRPAQN